MSLVLSCNSRTANLSLLLTSQGVQAMLRIPTLINKEESSLEIMLCCKANAAIIKLNSPIWLSFIPVANDSRAGERKIRATAYTHTEADHLKCGRANAVGTPLKYGEEGRSAAADWSKFPVGTKFRIAGESAVYEIDDYGGALVGRDVIDLYKPTKRAMNAWGARQIEIEVIEWGCFERSLKILAPRAKYAKHVAKMVGSLRARKR